MGRHALRDPGRRAARLVDVARPAALHGDPGPTCGAPRPIDERRAARLEQLYRTHAGLPEVTPQQLRDAALGELDPGDLPDTGDESLPDKPDVEPLDRADQQRYLAAHMVAYLEWPHIDGKFAVLFDTMPGRRSCYWFDSCAPDVDAP